MSDLPKTIYLKDYQVPAYLINTVDLLFELEEEKTRVTAELQIQKNPKSRDESNSLQLAGKDLRLIDVRLDEEVLSAAHYAIDAETLKIASVPENFTLKIVTEIEPQNNTALEGLYKSSGMFCTQCEAEGFRRMTYFLDQPDVMAVYTTRIEADRSRYPVLLSNGNKIASGELPGNRHWVKWHDPFPKPSYLFALVAGDLQEKQTTFSTRSGREVTLQIFVEAANIDKCEHALESLKKAMRWDEVVYGREYDLDIFMIVAVNDFNMGAMENKGLNIFNSACVLAKPETATDADYSNIEGIIGHEYFHNWSGNRVTCRDWFQLSLKEGFTVFRDQEFSADMTSRAVKRIADVNVLRTAQFPQDAGPMAHPIRPDAFIDISNFYTVTIYNKGAEIVRMLHHLLGRETFRKATDLYFERHDGEAVTTEDFVQAMEDASNVDLRQFKRWYSQAGTPELHIKGEYDAAKKTYTLTVKQTCPATPGQETKAPFHIPFALGLLDSRGKELPLKLRDEAALSAGSVFELKEEETILCFEDIPESPIPSLLRGFSAPVKVFFDYEKYDLRFLMSHDKDEFNRWDAGQRLANSVILEMMEDRKAGRAMGVYVGITEAFAYVLSDKKADKSLITQALSIPNEILLAELFEKVDPDAIHEAREFLCDTIAKALEIDFLALYHENNLKTKYTFDAENVARRSLKNQCLAYLVRLNTDEAKGLAMQQYRNADNMTDALAALSCLASVKCDERTEVLNDFYRNWKHDPLVIDKWFTIQARCTFPDTLEEIKQLVKHRDFDIKNPNKVRSVVGSLAFGNPSVFHQADGKSYEFLSDQIIALNDLNPQMAARMANAFSSWKRYDLDRQEKMKAALEKILAYKTLSKDVFEIVNKTLMATTHIL